MTVSRKVQFAGVIGLSVTTCLASPILAGAQARAPAARESNSSSETKPGEASDSYKAKVFENVEGKVTTIIHEHWGVPLSKITPSAVLSKDFGVDSLDIVEFVFALEEEFHMELSEKVSCEFEKSATVGDVFRIIKGCDTHPSPLSSADCSWVQYYSKGVPVPW